MRLFNKLPNFVRSRAGLEWLIFKKLPRLTLAATLLPCIPMAYIVLSDSMSLAQQTNIYMLLGIIISAWFFIGTLAIACIIVMLMKGPAYVADPYQMPIEDISLEKLKD